MDLDDAGSPSYNRDKTAPFLIRTFVKIGGFHRLTLFEDGTLPTTDEQQIFTWKDATLREVLTTLRNTAPHVVEYRHPLARFSFRTVYADPSNKGRFASKDIGMVYSRDILGEPGAVNITAPRLLLDNEPSSRDTAVGGNVDEKAPESASTREERTLDELRFMPGDYLCVSVLLPKNVTLPTELSIKGSGAAPGAWKSPISAVPPGRGDGGWGRGAAPSGPGLGRGGGGGGHWRGGSDAPPTRGGRGGRADIGRDRDRDRDLDRDSRVPPPRRHDSPPPPRGGGWGDRGGRNRRSPSRSRSPPRRRR
ncbi:hypothetical protein D9619_000130 [Psilocybe cf. subviscida]|uniref:Histone deacetylase complex subunit SAP18 n=1 Tax=Psilocybe cf. subviscida TaxID=2480587 RepID=A0A8H5BDB4_9AGAR|nr:hypothetical protein D9619_000130 [Psilocybe cf. subviscida]